MMPRVYTTKDIKRSCCSAVHAAVTKSILPKPETMWCMDFCGRRASGYDHYAGYTASTKLVVHPVCRACHIAREWARGAFSKKTLAKNRQLGLKKAHEYWRNLTHCKRGHEFTPENTYIKPDGNRNCRICRNDSSKRSKSLASVSLRMPGM